MKQYIDLLNHILENGNTSGDRTGTGTIKVFGYQLRHKMSDGFPLLTTKKIFWKGVAAELLWFLSGDTNVNTLINQGVHIWDAWADDVTGDLGPVYGYQWRKWDGQLDQIQNLVDGINRTPDSRRLIVTAWNPTDVPMMKLPPCHPFWQCQVDGEYLNLSIYMRSCDAFLGAPFNIASYALLLSMLCAVTKLTPGELIVSFGDLHIYLNHLDQVKEQIGRQPRNLPSLGIVGRASIFDFTINDFSILNYDPHPAIKAPIAV